MRLFILLFIILSCLPIYSQWNDLSSLNAVHFYDTQNGWAVGDYGKILRSTDGGKSWITQASGTNSDLLSVFALSEYKAFVSGILGTLLFTTDGGNSWTKKNTNTFDLISNINFSNPTTGYYIANNKLFSTFDEGASWSIKFTFFNTIKWLEVSDNEYLWVVDNKNFIYKSSDAGSIWHQVFSNPNEIRAFCAPDRYVGYVGVSDTRPVSTLFRMTNSGGSFDVISKPGEVYSRMDNLFFTSQDEGFCTGMNDVYAPSLGHRNYIFIAKTIDGGSNWSIVHKNEHTYIKDMFFLNSTHGWVVGEKGLLTSTTDGGSTWNYASNITPLELKNVATINQNNRHLLSQIVSGKSKSLAYGVYHQYGENYIPFIYLISDGKLVSTKKYSGGGDPYPYYMTNSISFMGENHCAVTYYYKSQYLLDIVNLNTMQISKHVSVNYDYNLITYKDAALGYTKTSSVFRLLDTNGLSSFYYSVPFGYSDIESDGDYLYFLATDRKIIKYDLENGTELFKTNSIFSSLLSISEKAEIYALNNDKLIKLDSNGVKRWEYSTNEFTMSGCVEYTATKKVYLYGITNYLICLQVLNAETGELLNKLYQPLNDGSFYLGMNMMVDINEPYMFLVELNTAYPSYPEHFYKISRFSDTALNVVEPNFIIHDYKLSQNYPNPFNPATRIDVHVAQTDLVILKVYDILGNEVSTLVNAELKPGVYSYEFNGKNLSSGVYLCVLKTSAKTDVIKMTLIK